MQNATKLKETLFLNRFDIIIETYERQARFVSLSVTSLVVKSVFQVLNHDTFVMAYIQYFNAIRGLHTLTNNLHFKELEIYENYIVIQQSNLH